MPKPEWLKNNERLRKLKRCIYCEHRGQPCGYTKNAGHGRMVMYQCNKLPNQKFHEETFACEYFSNPRIRR